MKEAKSILMGTAVCGLVQFFFENPGLAVSAGIISGIIIYGLLRLREMYLCQDLGI